MDNDLISRSALKEEVALMWGDNNHITDSMYEIIDNALTVEQPQGEWEEINERIGIGEDNIYTSFKCPFCGYIDLLENNYCGKCGAKMKQG